MSPQGSSGPPADRKDLRDPHGTEPIHIRRAELGDAPAIATLSGELGYPATAEQIRRRLQAVLGASGDLALVASIGDGTVVGWLHVFTPVRLESEPFAELGGLVVSAAHRGRGIGEQLLSAAEAWVTGQGISRLRVRSRSTRERAHRFYERVGFVRFKSQVVFDKAL